MARHRRAGTTVKDNLTSIQALRTLILIAITLSMVVYWEGVVRAYGIPATNIQPSGATNAGIVSSPNYVPIQEPQAQIATLLEEYPLVDPYFVEEAERIVFHTSFGDYAFSKTQPSMSFTYRDGTPLIRDSVFYVNSTTASPILFLNYTIDRTTLTTNRLDYSAKLQASGVDMGNIHVSIVFDRVQRPKISVKVDPSNALASAGFNVMWILGGYGNFARSKSVSSGFNMSATGANRFRTNDTMVDLGPPGEPSSWRVWAQVDWTDAATSAELLFAQQPVLSFLHGPSVAVLFTSNVAVLDPVVVGASSMTGSAASFQRRAYFDGTNYWVFYHNGTHTVYEYSNDGRSWNNPVVAVWPYSPTALWFKGTSVYALASSSETGVTGGEGSPATVYLYFKKGTMSGNSINWGSTVTVDTYVYGSGGTPQAAIRDVNLVVGPDSLITVAYTEAALTRTTDCSERHCSYTYSSVRMLNVKKSTSTNGDAWGAATTVLSETTSSTSDAWNHHYRPILANSTSNLILGIYNDEGVIKYSKSNAWSTVSSFTTGKNIEQFGSAVSDLESIVHLVFVGSDDTIQYSRYTGSSWGSPLTIASATSSSPAIAIGDEHDLHVLYLKASVVYYVRYSILNGFYSWGSPTTPFGTSFAAPAHLTAVSDATNGLLTALWTEGTANPYSVKLGSFPVESVWSPYAGNSDPWDKEGLIPYGHYFQNLQEYVSPNTGLLTIVQTDLSLPGRGFTDIGPLSFTRVFRTPYTFLAGAPYNYESYPYVNLGLGWSLNWPWLGANYLHLWDGEGYKIVWTVIPPQGGGEGGGGTSGLTYFENHQGEHFLLTKNANNTYSLHDKSSTIYQFDTSKRLIYMLDRTRQNKVTFTYDASSRISYVTDTVGRTINFSYDANGRLSSLNSGGRVWTFGYNANGNLVSVLDPLGRITSYEYTSAYSNYLLTKMTYPTNAYSAYTYSEGQVGTETKTYRVSQQSTRLGDGTTVRQTSFAYTVGSADRVISSTLTYSDGTTIQGYVKYDFETSKVTLTTQNAQAQTIQKSVDEYNSQGAFRKQTMFLGASASNYTNYFRYDSWGNVVYQRLAIDPSNYRETFFSYLNTDTQNRFVDYNGNNVTDFSNSFYANSINFTIHDRLAGRAEYQNGAGSNKIESYYLYSNFGNQLEQKDRLDTQWLITAFIYDSYGNVLTSTDAKGNQTSYEYSATYQSAYPTKISNTVGGVVLATQFAYNFTTGDMITATSPSANLTDYRYDSIGRLYKVIQPAIGGVRAERRIAYDDINNIATIFDENGNYVKYYYDGLARMTKLETYANSSVYSTETYTYYWNSKLRSRTDPTGNVTTYEYDFLTRTVKLTHPDGTYRQWIYDDVNVKVTFKDEKLHPTDYDYDWLGRLVTVTEYLGAQGSNTYYTYDRVGNLLQIKDALNQITSYTYDSLNRPTRIDFPDATHETRSYDKVGNLVSRTTQNNTVLQYAYDQINRLTKISYPDGSTVSYTYDKDSNRLRMVDSASTTDYTYDPRSRLLSETRTIDGQAYALSYLYDAASNLIRLTYPDGYQVNYVYDALNRIVTVGNLATITYRKDSTVSSITYGNGVRTTYSYDQLDRVTRILTQNSTRRLLDLNYAYDANGNLLTVNTSEETYGYDDLNRLTAGNGPWGTLSYSYDVVGNRLSQTLNGTGTSYSYGSYNRLLSAGSTTYTYDPNGNRITQTTGSNTFTYIYDYQNRLRQVKLNSQAIFQAWYDGDGRRIKTSDATTRIYHYAACSCSWDPIYVKDLTTGVVTDMIFGGNLRIGKVQGGVNYYYHLDRLGSVRLVTRDQGTYPFISNYLPYGQPYAASGSELFRYTGKQLDLSTGLDYFGYRYYDGQIGRFITPDLHEPNYLNPQSLNRYTYALDNPYAYVDPDGRVAVLVVLIALAEVIAALFIINQLCGHCIGLALEFFVLDPLANWIGSHLPPKYGVTTTTTTASSQSETTTTRTSTITYNGRQVFTFAVTWVTRTTSSGKSTTYATTITVTTAEGSTTYHLRRGSVISWVRYPDGTYGLLITEEYQA